MVRRADGSRDGPLALCDSDNIPTLSPIQIAKKMAETPVKAREIRFNSPLLFTTVLSLTVSLTTS